MAYRRQIKLVVTTEDGRSESSIRHPHVTDVMLEAAGDLVTAMCTGKRPAGHAEAEVAAAPAPEPTSSPSVVDLMEAAALGALSALAYDMKGGSATTARIRELARAAEFSDFGDVDEAVYFVHHEDRTTVLDAMRAARKLVRR